MGLNLAHFTGQGLFGADSNLTQMKVLDIDIIFHKWDSTGITDSTLENNAVIFEIGKWIIDCVNALVPIYDEA